MSRYGCAFIALLFIATAAFGQQRHDLLMGSLGTIEHWSAPPTQPGNWSSSTYRSNLPGPVIAIDGHERLNGDFHCLVNGPTGFGIYRDTTRFLPAPIVNPPPTAVLVYFNAADTLTDFKLDWSVPGGQFVVVGTNLAGGFVQHVSLTGASGTRSILPGSAGSPFVAVDPATGSTYVVDATGNFYQFGGLLGLISTNVIAGFSPSDIAWCPRPAGTSEPLVIVGLNLPLNVGALQRFSTGGVATNPAIQTGPLAPRSVSVNNVGDQYWLQETSSGVDLIHREINSGALSISPADSSKMAISWFGRSATGRIGVQPGNGLTTSAQLIRAPMAGDTSLDYTVPVNTSHNYSSPYWALATGYDLVPPPSPLGPQCLILVNASATVFSTSETFPTVSIQISLDVNISGVPLYTQLIAFNMSLNRWESSNLVAFVVGAAPLD